MQPDKSNVKRLRRFRQLNIEDAAGYHAEVRKFVLFCGAKAAEGLTVCPQMPVQSTMASQPQQAEAAQEPPK